jgi:hypothetical protein
MKNTTSDRPLKLDGGNTAVVSFKGLLLSAAEEEKVRDQKEIRK